MSLNAGMEPFVVASMSGFRLPRSELYCEGAWSEEMTVMVPLLSDCQTEERSAAECRRGGAQTCFAPSQSSSEEGFWWENVSGLRLEPVAIFEERR